MITALLPELQILAYPHSGLPGTDATCYAPDVDSFHISDTIADLLLPQGGDGSGLSSTDTGSPASEWQGQSNFTGISNNLATIRFRPDGTVAFGKDAASGDGLGGFYLKPRIVPVNLYVSTQTVGAPNRSSDYTSIACKPLAGAQWVSKLPDDFAATFVYHTSQQPDTVIAISTVTKLIADGSFSCPILWMGVADKQTQPPAFRMIFGAGQYSIVWRKDASPAVEIPDGANWKTLRTLSEAPVADFKGRVRVRVMLIAGYLVVQLNEQGWWFSGGTTDAPREATIATGPLTFRGYGVQCAVGYGQLLYNETSQHAITAPFSRSLPRQARGVPIVTGSAKAAGWLKKGTAANVAVTPALDKVDYVVTMTADKAGTYTPFVSLVGGQFDSTTIARTGTPIDIRPAVDGSIDIMLAQPPHTSGSSCTIPLDDIILEQLDPDGTYVAPFNLIQVRLRRAWSDDGTRNTGAWRTWTFYQMSLTRNTGRINEQKLSLNCSDAAALITDPGGFIGPQYAALDTLLLRDQSKRELYDVDAVQYWLRTALGPTFANAINANGNPFAFLPPSPIPLISRNNDRTGFVPLTITPPSSGFAFPPKFGETVLSSIKSLAASTYGTFFIGYHPGMLTDAPVPIYGRWTAIVNTFAAARGLVVLPDAVYVEADRQKMIRSIQKRFKPERAFNEVYVWGARPDSDGVQLVPSLVSGYSRLDSSDPSAREFTFPRTLLISQEVLSSIGGSSFAQGLASAVMSELAGVQPNDIQMVISGDELLDWGQIVQPKMIAVESDSSGNISYTALDMNNKSFRVMQVGHKIDVIRGGASAFTTNFVARPLLNNGL